MDKKTEILYHSPVYLVWAWLGAWLSLPGNPSSPITAGFESSLRLPAVDQSGETPCQGDVPGMWIIRVFFLGGQKKNTCPCNQNGEPKHLGSRHFWCVFVTIGLVQENYLHDPTRVMDFFKVASHMLNLHSWSLTVRHSKVTGTPKGNSSSTRFFFEGLRGVLPSKLTWNLKSPLWKGKSSSKPLFWGSMLVFGVV